MLFSMLANLAEDRQGIAAEPGADVSAALKRLKSHDIGVDQVMKLLDKALIVPVLTAHPTIGYRCHSLASSDDIGRATCRERVCQCVSISVVAVALKKK